MTVARTASKEAKEKKKASHPTYREMITEAVSVQSKRGTGVSLQAIKSYLSENYALPETFPTHVKQALHKMVEDKQLEKVTSQSYKFTSNYKKEVKKQEKGFVGGATRSRSVKPVKRAYETPDEEEKKRKSRSTSTKKVKKVAPRTASAAKRAKSVTRKPLKSESALKKKTGERVKKAQARARTQRSKQRAAARAAE
jgi:hypothetical protein